MKITKLLFFSSFILFLIFFLSIYHLNKLYKNTIHNLEKKHNIKITIKEKPQWIFFPEILINVKSKIENNVKDYSSENLNISFFQKFTISPLQFKINTDSFFFKDLEIKSLNALGNYNYRNKKITLNNINGKIGEGNFSTNLTLDTEDSQEIIFQGNLKNLHLNQVLRQLNLADWKRVEIKLSSNNFLLSSPKIRALLETLEGSLPLFGSVYFVTTEEERFGIAFLRLLIEKMPNYNNLSKSLSQIIEGFGGTPALFKGELKVKDGIIKTNNLIIENTNNQININGSYNYIKDKFDIKVHFFESDNLVVETMLVGKLDSPSIQIIRDKTQKDNYDLKKVFEEGIRSLIDKLLETGD